MIFNNLAFHSTMDLKQIFPIESGSDSYIFNYAQLDHFFERCITWHWHSFFELNYIMEGEIELRTTNSVYTLKEGDISFVNSGVIHHVSAKDKMKGCRLCSFFFDIHFLTGMYNTALKHKYILPVLKNRKLQAYTIRPNTYERVCMIQNFLKMLKLDEQELFGYEFELRTELSRFWCAFLKETENLRDPNTESSSVDTKRMKCMLQYIHNHYMEKISLEDIAGSANICSRECSRCFQRNMQTSPMSYLKEYRIRMAAQMLLQTDQSIMAVGDNCGFSSGSYFTKTFQEFMGCTPKEFRK